MTDTPPEFASEIEHGFDAYSDDELLEQSRFNAQAWLLASSQALEEGRRGAWVRSVAETFLRSWDTRRSWEAAELLDALLTNYRSFGADVIEAHLGADEATATIANLPDQQLCGDLGISDDRVDLLFDVGAQIVAALGHALEWAREAESSDIRLRIT